MLLLLWLSSAVWPDWTTFEMLWRHILLQYLPKYQATLCSIFNVKNCFCSFWALLVKLGQLLIVASGHTGHLANCFTNLILRQLKPPHTLQLLPGSLLQPRLPLRPVLLLRLHPLPLRRLELRHLLKKMFNLFCLICNWQMFMMSNHNYNAASSTERSTCPYLETLLIFEVLLHIYQQFTQSKNIVDDTHLYRTC